MNKIIYFLLALLFVLFFSCTTKNITIKKFHTTHDTIMVKGKTHLEWEVENADSIVIKQLGFDEPILEIAPPKSRMLVSPSFKADYQLHAYGKEQHEIKSCSLVVIDTVRNVPDTIIVPKAPIEPNNSPSDYLKGFLPHSMTSNSSDLKLDIFFIDKISYPREIKLYIAVKDKNGNFITDLAPPYGTRQKAEEFFSELVTIVNGKEHKIKNFTVEERHDTLVQKYSYSLVVDHSGSMYGDIDNLQNSVKHFISKLNPTDWASIIKFDEKVEESVSLTKNKSELLNPILYKGLDGFGGGTALIAGSDLGIKSIKDAKNTKIEVLFTDGFENASLYAAISRNDGIAYKTSQLIYNARENNVKVFTIGFGNVDTEILEKIAILTDGKSYYANNGKEILDIFDELPRIFSNYYLLTFSPIKEDGEHEIILKFKNNDGNYSEAKRKTHIGKLNLNDVDKFERQSIAYFEYSKDVLKDAYIPVIKRIAEFLTNYPKSKLEIHGHTDLTGSKSVNMNLSKRRAETVADVFINHGIDKSRITIIPHGSEEPMFDPEYSDFEKEQNRRVEFVIKD